MSFSHTHLIAKLCCKAKLDVEKLFTMDIGLGNVIQRPRRSNTLVDPEG